MVVPRSSELVAEDSEYHLYTVTLFKKVIDEFKSKAREQKYVILPPHPPHSIPPLLIPSLPSSSHSSPPHPIPPLLIPSLPLIPFLPSSSHPSTPHPIPPPHPIPLPPSPHMSTLPPLCRFVVRDYRFSTDSQDMANRELSLLKTQLEKQFVSEMLPFSLLSYNVTNHTLVPYEGANDPLVESEFQCCLLCVDPPQVSPCVG